MCFYYFLEDYSKKIRRLFKNINLFFKFHTPHKISNIPSWKKTGICKYLKFKFSPIFTIRSLVYNYHKGFYKNDG